MASENGPDLSLASRLALEGIELASGRRKESVPLDVSTVNTSMEDRLNAVMQEAGLPLYEDRSGIAGSFFKRP